MIHMKKVTRCFQACCTSSYNTHRGFQISNVYMYWSWCKML